MGSLCRAVLVATPAGSSNRGNMVSPKLALALCLLSGSALGARQLRGNRRESRNLLGTFPFNAQEGEHHGAHDDHHGHHEDHARHPVQALEARAQRQGDDTDVSFPAVAAAGPGADGKRCIDKVEMIEEIEYDDVVQCDHSYDRRCHTTYVTQYESQQEEVEENFRKSCFIEYEQIAFNETAEICRTPLVKDCDVQGPEICRTEYESESGPSRRFTMSRTTLLSAPPRSKRSVRMRPLATPPTPSAPSGQGRCAPSPRSK